MRNRICNLARAHSWRWIIAHLLVNLACFAAWWICAPVAVAQVTTGKEIFRFDTFGDEQLWTDRLRLHEFIESNLDPLTALRLGLKVDADALPGAVRQAIANGDVDLTSPATTLVLIDLNAVVGIVGTVGNINGRNRLTKVGVTCALCHSTVDNSF